MYYYVYNPKKKETFLSIIFRQDLVLGNRNAVFVYLYEYIILESDGFSSVVSHLTLHANIISAVRLQSVLFVSIFIVITPQKSCIIHFVEAVHGTTQLLTWSVKSPFMYGRDDGDPLTSLLAYIMAKFTAKTLAHYSTACPICLPNTFGRR